MILSISNEWSRFNVVASNVIIRSHHLFILNDVTTYLSRNIIYTVKYNIKS
jgi:hypothetical protein